MTCQTQTSLVLSHAVDTEKTINISLSRVCSLQFLVCLISRAKDLSESHFPGSFML